jgi:hypothetical protein
MSNARDHACEVTREELVALRSEMEARAQRADVELARLRQRVRELEAQAKRPRPPRTRKARDARANEIVREAETCPECIQNAAGIWTCDRHSKALADNNG